MKLIFFMLDAEGQFKKKFYAKKYTNINESDLKSKSRTCKCWLYSLVLM